MSFAQRLWQPDEGRRSAAGASTERELMRTRASSSHREPRARSACTCGGSCPRCADKDVSMQRDIGPAGVERKNGVVHGPAGSPNHFDDCPTQWKTAANAAQTRGDSLLANVVNGLRSLPTPIPPPVATLLTKHFHTTYDKDIAKIAARFGKLATAIRQAIDFECETSCDGGTRAYVYDIWSDIHLCPVWFSSVPEQQTRSVIHELAHDVAGCDDNAYEWETAKYSNMSVNEAINNADSYAHFAVDAGKP